MAGPGDAPAPVTGDRSAGCSSPDALPEGVDFITGIDPASLEVLTACKLEPSLAEARIGEAVQFERLGYFAADPDSRPGALVFNRTVTLKDAWARIEKKQGDAAQPGAKR